MCQIILFIWKNKSNNSCSLAHQWRFHRFQLVFQSSYHTTVLTEDINGIQIVILSPVCTACEPSANVTAARKTHLLIWEHSASLGNTEELQAARRAVCQSFQFWKSVVWQMIQNLKWKKIHGDRWITLISFGWKCSGDCLGKSLLVETGGSWACVQTLHPT